MKNLLNKINNSLNNCEVETKKYSTIFWTLCFVVYITAYVFLVVGYYNILPIETLLFYLVLSLIFLYLGRVSGREQYEEVEKK